MMRAGLPATIAPAGTSFVTTEPAPTNALAPIVTPGSSTLPPPTRAARRMRGALAHERQTRAAMGDPLVVHRDDARAAEHLVLDDDARA